MGLVDKVTNAIASKVADLRGRAWAAGYEAAVQSRKDRDFAPDGKAQPIDLMSRSILRARTRDLERNSELIEAILQAINRNVIGAGMHMQARTKNERLNERIEALWKEWTYPENCDVTEQQSLTEMLSMILRRYWVDGGVLIVHCTNTNKQIPYQIQVREVDDLATGMYRDKQMDPNIIFSDGIEYTRQGKPVAYWLTGMQPDGMEELEPERIPADRVTFLWKRDRPSQFREIPRLAKSIVRTQDLEDYNAAVAFQQKTLACTSVFVETAEGSTNPVGRVANAGKGKRIEQISAGSVNYMRPGETVKSLVPTGQAAEFEDFTTTQMRITAAALGLSLEGTTRNVERVNYSSARQNLIEDNKTYREIKQYLLVHLMRPLYKRFLQHCYLAGLLDHYGFEPDDPSMYEVSWLTEGMPWIDPAKESQADNLALSNNTTTLMDICARNGKDWEEVLAQREREMKELAKRGLPLTAATNNNSQNNQDGGDTDNAKQQNEKSQNQGKNHGGDSNKGSK